MVDALQAVYERARVCVGEDTWPRLSAHEQTTAVYQELRALDAGRVQIRDQSELPDESFVSYGMTDQSIVRLRLAGQMEAWTVANENVLPTGRKTRALLAAYGIPFVAERAAADADEAVAAARELGFPVVVKTAAAVAMLLLAPRLVQGLSWPLMLATLFACMQTYWLALLWRGRAK